MGASKNLKVADIMTKKVITVSVQMPVIDVVHLVLEKRINGLPVVDDNGTLQGVVTTTNLFEFLDKVLFDHPLDNFLADNDVMVEEIMIKNVVSVSPETTIREVVHMSLYKGIHTFPVVENEKIVGIVGKRDILNAGYSLAIE